MESKQYHHYNSIVHRYERAKHNAMVLLQKGNNHPLIYLMQTPSDIVVFFAITNFGLQFDVDYFDV